MSLQLGAVAGLFNRPALLHPGSTFEAFGLLAQWAQAMRTGAGPKALEGDARSRYEWKPYGVIEGTGVALIPVRGILINRLGAYGWWCEDYIQGYDQLRLMLLTALADEEVDAIVLSVDSPGGEVAGCFDLVDTIFEARSVKPIWAILEENAYSAAYAIASAASKVFVPRTGGTGSVGVICEHLSIAGFLSQLGIEPTLVFAGDRKADFSEYSPLSEDARKRLQADVDATAALFHQTVARNRGLSAADVAALQAGTFQGKAGVDLGLADGVASPDGAFRDLLKQLG